MAGDQFQISQLAVPAVSVLICFLAYTSQYFFLHFEPAPLQVDEVWRINIFALCIWVCYYRTCFVDPGRLPSDKKHEDLNAEKDHARGRRQRWCRRCEAYKPPRAHHCKTCKRCIPKMDHHCPWTANCVSHFTFPHFMRFLFYAVVGMSYLEKRLFKRVAIVWDSRDLPSYLGPSVGQLIHLFILFVLNSVTVFGLFVLLLRVVYSLSLNTTTIESWEIERHATLVRRARALGGYLDGPGGMKVRIMHQEFPYDIGILTNIKEGMGGSWNIIGWFWPFAATPDRRTGWEFEENGFENAGVSWPPPDPDRIPMPDLDTLNYNIATYASAREEVDAFHRRQEADFSRRRPFSQIQKRQKFHERYQGEHHKVEDGDEPVYGDSDEGEEGWRNSEGENLGNYGVDIEAEFYDEDEDDVPLAVLINRRKQNQ
ncbi:hypothetical protein N7495_004753 [Penicillium taxi]|uniref:uncharacterized protein n=1 Tax=Penicillium taxi TaxID=168475 RepID=UPI002544F7BB|nr:uncharacterized protein N7495_004753 [Penicillium taxi]KAJ5900009.1 hypothetical protein N7495_004753 [Penicillium taxi]